MKKIIIILISLIFLTGCWDLRETEEIGFASLIGIDVADNNRIKLMIQDMAPPKGGSDKQSGGSSKTTEIESHEAIAQTISEAINKINATNNSVTDFSHTYTIVLSEEFVKTKGISPVIDFLERTPEIRRNVWILIAKKGQLTDLCSIDTISKVSSNPGKSIMEIVKNNPSCSIISANTLGDFLNMTWETGNDAYTAGVELIKKSTEKSNVFDISVRETAVFKKEKFCGWLSDEETMGLLWVKGKIKGGTISVNIKGENVSFIIKKAKAKIKPQIADNKMKVFIEIYIESKLAESQMRQDYIDLNVISSIQDALKEKVKAQIVSAFEKTQAYDSDVFGFGNYFYGNYPEFWKQIESNKNDYFKDITIELNIVAKQWNLGLIK